MGSVSNGSHARNDTDCYEDQSFSLFDVHVLVPVTMISILLFFLGVSGNLITILLFDRSQGMRTTVNMYLSSMALSDTLVFLGPPSDLYRIWKYRPYIFGDFLCKFLIYLSETCTCCTILHITAVSVERCLAICFPLRAKATITKRRAKRVILALWGRSLLSAGPVLFLFGVEEPRKGCKATSPARYRELSDSGSARTRVPVAWGRFRFWLSCPRYGAPESPPSSGYGRSHKEGQRGPILSHGTS
nr:PREDICTED: motilin receptor-like [Struthio camelus australis]